VTRVSDTSMESVKSVQQSTVICFEYNSDSGWKSKIESCSVIMVQPVGKLLKRLLRSMQLNPASQFRKMLSSGAIQLYN